MSKPFSRQLLADYCLRSLGAPVIEINLDDDQIDDRIDESIQFYQEYHNDAIIRTFRKHQIAAADLQNKYIKLPQSLLFVSRVLPLINNNSFGSSMWSARYQMMLNDIYDLQYAGALVNYDMTRQYLELLDMMLNGVPPVRFNRHMQTLFIDVEWGYELKVGDYVIVEGYESIDPDSYNSVYNDMFLKKYTTALFKKQWGNNLKKFEGVTLPGGVTLNGQQIYNEALEEITKLEEEIQLRFEMPPVFFIG